MSPIFSIMTAIMTKNIAHMVGSAIIVRSIIIHVILVRFPSKNPCLLRLLMLNAFIYSNIMSGREIKERFDKACDERREIKADIKQLNQNFIEHL